MEHHSHPQWFKATGFILWIYSKFLRQRRNGVWLLVGYIFVCGGTEHIWVTSSPAWWLDIPRWWHIPGLAHPRYYSGGGACSRQVLGWWRWEQEVSCHLARCRCWVMVSSQFSIIPLPPAPPIIVHHHHARNPWTPAVPILRLWGILPAKITRLLTLRFQTHHLMADRHRNACKPENKVYHTRVLCQSLCCSRARHLVSAHN